MTPQTGSDVDVWVKEIDSIDAGASKVYSVTTNHGNWVNDGQKDHWSMGTAGSFAARAYVDSFNYVGSESDESDNQATITYTVVAPIVTPVVTPTPTPTSDQRTITNSIGMEFVLIPAGEFDMGLPESENRDDEGPVHHVKLSNAFYMGKYEVTQKQWREVMENNPSYFKGDNLPVEQVSWNDVQEFIKKLNEKEGTNKYRLPSGRMGIWGASRHNYKVFLR